MAKTTLQLDLEDVLGNPLDDHSVRMDVFSLDNMRHFQAVIPLSGQQQVNVALADCPGGVYRIELTATNYRMLQFFLRLEEGETARRDPLKFPVNPALVTGIDAPAFSALDDGLQRLLNSSAFHNEAGSNLYDSLPDLLKACLLNIFVKASATTLDDGSNTFHHFDEITNFVQDRLFIRTTSALFEETAVSGKFHRVPFALHTVPLPFQMFDSFKTRDAHGNLQLTFARTPDNQYLVDVDIDEAQGIEHVFEVVRNSVAGLTNPYNVREILCEAQGLSPLYSFAFAERGIAVVAAGASQ